MLYRIASHRNRWCGVRTGILDPSIRALELTQSESKQASLGGWRGNGKVGGRDSSSIETMRVGHKTISCRKDVTAADSRDPTRK